MRTFLAVVAILTIAAAAHADMLVAWDFNGYVGSEAVGTSTTVNANMEDPAYITRGAGAVPALNGGRFNANNWTETSLANAITAEDYFTWTINADPGYVFAVTNVAFNFQRSSTGGQDWALRSSADGFATDIQTWSALGNGSYNTDTVLGSASSLEFRFYGYNGSSTAGTAGFEGTGDDLTVYGTLAAIPEPTTLALLAAGLALLLNRRRKM